MDVCIIDPSGCMFMFYVIKWANVNKGCLYGCIMVFSLCDHMDQYKHKSHQRENYPIYYPPKKRKNSNISHRLYFWEYIFEEMINFVGSMEQGGKGNIFINTLAGIIGLVGPVCKEINRRRMLFELRV